MISSQHLLHSGEKGGAAGVREERLERVSQGWDRDAQDDLIFKSSAKPWSEIWSYWPCHHHGSKRIHSEIQQ